MPKIADGLFAGLAAFLFLSMLQVPLGGCDTAKTAADSTSELFVRAAPGVEQHWDYELVGDSMAPSIIQLEGILRLVPDNKAILLSGLKAYLGYAYGWIEDEVEIADRDDNLEEAERLRRKARVLYQRALDLGFHYIGIDHPNFDKALAAGHDPLTEWLKKNMSSEGDAEILLWLGQAWGAYINMDSGDMDKVADLPLVKALVRRSVEIDPDHFYSTGKMALGIVASQEIGGDMDMSKTLFDEALAETERRNLITQVNMARYYAVQMGDQKLFKGLLQEVLDAGDVLPENRLSNVIARRRAERYINMGDFFFSDYKE